MKSNLSCWTIIIQRNSTISLEYLFSRATAVGFDCSLFFCNLFKRHLERALKELFFTWTYNQAMQALFCQQMIRKNLWTYSNLWLLCWCCIQQTYYWSLIWTLIILKSSFGCVKETCHMNISGCFWWCVWYYVNHFLTILCSVLGWYHC